MQDGRTRKVEVAEPEQAGMKLVQIEPLENRLTSAAFSHSQLFILRKASQ